MASLIAPFRCSTSQYHLTLSLSTTPIRSTLSATTSLLRTRTLSRLRLSVVYSMSQPASSASDSTFLLSQNDDTAKAESSDVVVQYVVLRRDLIDSWPLGSVVTQGCHASVSAVWSHREDPDTVQYCSPQNIDSMHKVKTLWIWNRNLLPFAFAFNFGCNPLNFISVLWNLILSFDIGKMLIFGIRKTNNLPLIGLVWLFLSKYWFFTDHDW